MSILIPFLVVVHVLICLLMVFLVLMQRPRSEGLGAAFGGGVTDNIFGAQTSQVLQKFTVYLGGGFFALTLLIAILYSRVAAGPTSLEGKLLGDEPATSSPAAPAPAVEVEETAVEVEATTEQTSPPSEASPETSGSASPIEALPVEVPKPPAS